jgi:hypothetical protein
VLGRVNELALSMGRWFIDAGRKVAIFGGLAGTALGALVNRVTSTGDATIKLARQVGLTSEKLQEWQFAADRAGIPAAEFGELLLMLSKRFGDARKGSAEALAPYRVLGIALEDAEGRARSLAEVFPDIADGIASLDQESSRNNFATAIFGRAGMDLNKLLAGGSAELEAMGAEARRLGAVVSEDKLKGFEAFQDNLTNVKYQLGGISATVVDALLPGIEKVTLAFSAWLVDHKGHLTEWAAWLGERLPQILDRLWANMKGAWRWMQPMLEKVVEAVKAADRLGQMMGFTERANTAPKREASEMRSRRGDIMRAVRSGDLDRAQRSWSDLIGESVLRTSRDAGGAAASLAGSILVRFAGAPAGTRVEMDRALRRAVDLQVGYAMPGVGGR